MFKTIYPVTHHFYPILEHSLETKCVNEFLMGLNKDNDNQEEGKIYIHIPFCTSKCLFCPFHLTIPSKTNLDVILDEYVNALIKEMQLLSETKIKDISVKAIYFGGGSPSLLSIKNLMEIFRNLYHCFNINDNVEITFEGEPISLANNEKLDFLKESGVKRISYGVQTFDEQLRNHLKIAASLRDIHQCQEMLQYKNFEEINIDMMFYLPGQTISALDRDLQKLMVFNADSFDYYYLSYYSFPKVFFDNMKQGKVPPKPSESKRNEMWRYIQSYMENTNYFHKLEYYFSRKESIPESFRILWGGGNGKGTSTAIALGLSSRGYINGVAYANCTDLSDYYDFIKNNQLPINMVSEKVEPDNRGMVFYSKFFEIDKDQVPNHYLNIFENLKKSGYIVLENGKYIMTSEGKDWLPNITMEFFTPHQKELSDSIVKRLENHYSNKVTVYG